MKLMFFFSSHHQSINNINCISFTIILSRKYPHLSTGKRPSDILFKLHFATLSSLTFTQSTIIKSFIMMLTNFNIVGVVACAAAYLAMPVAARTWAGSVDMNQACSEQYGGGWTAKLSGSSGNDWSCVDGSGNSKSINVDAYCSQTYGNAAYADPQGGGAYDWGCYWR